MNHNLFPCDKQAVCYHGVKHVTLQRKIPGCYRKNLRGLKQIHFALDTFIERTSITAWMATDGHQHIIEQIQCSTSSLLCGASTMQNMKKNAWRGRYWQGLVTNVIQSRRLWVYAIMEVGTKVAKYAFRDKCI